MYKFYANAMRHAKGREHLDHILGCAKRASGIGQEEQCMITREYNRLRRLIRTRYLCGRRLDKPVRMCHTDSRFKQCS